MEEFNPKELLFNLFFTKKKKYSLFHKILLHKVGAKDCNNDYNIRKGSNEGNQMETSGSVKNRVI